ncbi:MAG: pentapeptide repeat-containing protein [Gammaproteobacteria bacterium]|nr:pentapeptide repeat-containing protein [Gammaproteobacteria bacterium]
MNQEQLNRVILLHEAWLKSDGKRGRQANFSSAYMDQRYGKPEQKRFVLLHPGGAIVDEIGRYPEDLPNKQGYLVSHFEGLNFSTADLRNCNLDGAFFHNCKMPSVNLGDNNFENAIFVKVNLEGAKFGFPIRCSFKESKFIRCEFANSFLQNVDFSGADLCGTSFINTNFINSIFKGSQAQGTKFISLGLAGADLSDCNLSHATFNNVDLSGSNISHSNLKLAELKHVNLSGLQWKLKGYFKRLSEAFKRERTPFHLGCRIDSCYGNERFIKAVREESYIEEVARDKIGFYRFWLLSSDCGKSIALWILWSAVMVTMFAFLYSSYGETGFTFSNDMTCLIRDGSFLPYVYYSVVTFTTLGFGDITPSIPATILLVISEVILGFVMLGLLISVLASKVFSRS